MDSKGDVIVGQLQQMGLFTSSFIPDCSVPMTSGYYADYHDVIVYMHSCCRKMSPRTGNFTTRPRLTLRQVTIIVVNWIIKAPVTLAVTLSDVTEAPAVQWYEYCPDICAMKMTSLNQSFGGIGKIVEIDEKFVRKVKFDRGKSVKKDWVNGTSLSILQFL